MSDIEVLSKNQMVECFKKNDKESRNNLIKSNMRLVLSHVRKYVKKYDDYEDFVSVGTIGLIKAVDTFDLSKNVQFSTYACKCIDYEIFKYIRSNNKVVSSLNEPLCDEFTLEDTIESDVDIVGDFEKKAILNQIKDIISELSEKQRRVMLLRFGLLDNHFYQVNDIAEILGVSRQSISKLTKNAIEAIRKKLELTGEVIEINENTINDFFVNKDNIGDFYNSLVDIINEYIYCEDKMFFEPLYIKDLDIIKTSIFTKIINSLSTRDNLILRMKFGYQGKYYKTNEVAAIFGITDNDVINTVKRVLKIYKNSLNKEIKKTYTLK